MQLAYRDTLDTNPPFQNTSALYEDTSALVAKSGSWSTVTNGSASGGSYVQSNTTNDYAEVIFSGDGVSWAAMTSDNQGIAKVYLDGVYQADVDLYRYVGCISWGVDPYGNPVCTGTQSAAYQQTVWSITGLSYGVHTIRVVVSGTKNGSSSGFNVNVDYFYATDSSNPNNLGPRRF